METLLVIVVSERGRTTPCWISVLQMCGKWMKVKIRNGKSISVWDEHWIPTMQGRTVEVLPGMDRNIKMVNLQNVYTTSHPFGGMTYHFALIDVLLRKYPQSQQARNSKSNPSNDDFPIPALTALRR
ncbi:RNI-like superfamily protein [Striga asiatica]|uniref:RNI-like superfamily protein n=1 Tax=Striga asiatica TaxID=4170 RepID=A0A5A7PR17_STRAF|nr:RNI-like superfamily protein [Striga asiatica]